MRKVKNYLKIGLLLIGVLLTTVNCEKEKIEEELSVSDTVINDLFETVSIEESKEFFINRKLKNLEARVYDPIELEPDLSRISQEEILNTSTKITVIPATTIHQDIETRILQVKSNTGEIHSLLFNEIPDVSNSNSSYFSGIISLTTLSGDFIEGFRVEDGNAVSEFVVQSGTLGDCNESLNPNSIFCNQQLQEIFLGSQSIVTINSYTSQSFNQGPVYQSYIWRYNNNGYYGYAQGYMNYLRSLPCDNPDQVRNENAYCVDIDELPPSCKSFEFERVGNAQYSYVRGIRFLVISEDGNGTLIKYDSAIEFSGPYQDRFNNVYSSGALAETSAKALQEAMDNTKNHIRNNFFSNQGDIERYFEQELIRIYPMHIPGGRVRIRPDNFLTSKITDYIASGFSYGGVNFGTDNCN